MDKISLDNSSRVKDALLNSMTVTQRFDSDRPASSSVSGKNDAVMTQSLEILNAVATGTTLQIVNGSVRLPDTLTNEN